MHFKLYFYKISGIWRPFSVSQLALHLKTYTSSLATEDCSCPSDLAVIFLQLYFVFSGSPLLLVYLEYLWHLWLGLKDWLTHTHTRDAGPTTGFIWSLLIHGFDIPQHVKFRHAPCSGSSWFICGVPWALTVTFTVTSRSHHKHNNTPGRAVLTVNRREITLLVWQNNKEKSNHITLIVITVWNRIKILNALWTCQQILQRFKTELILKYYLLFIKSVISIESTFEYSTISN